MISSDLLLFMPQTKFQLVGFVVWVVAHSLVQIWIGKGSKNRSESTLNEKENQMVTDIDALKKAVKLVATATNDFLTAPGEIGPVGRILIYQNLIPELISLMPKIGEIPEEASNLSSEDIAALVAELSANLSLPIGKSEELVKASLKLLSDLAVIIVPDIVAVVAAAKAA